MPAALVGDLLSCRLLSDDGLRFGLWRRNDGAMGLGSSLGRQRGFKAVVQQEWSEHKRALPGTQRHQRLQRHPALRVRKAHTELSKQQLPAATNQPRCPAAAPQ